MDRPTLLLERLNEIGASLERTGKAYALLGLGSVGLELGKLDEYSDLDFFAIVQEGYKQDFLDNLNWLSDINQIDYAVRNTVDGYKVLYKDGVFCEFAVFEPQELTGIPFAEGRIVWQQADFNSQSCIPKPHQANQNSDLEWIIGEALTNLYVGMCRYKRGEKLSGMRFVQSFALDRLIELAERIETPSPELADQFMSDRRLEVRFPEFARLLPSFTQGYERTPESTTAQLSFLNTHFRINQAMRARILDLCEM